MYMCKIFCNLSFDNTLLSPTPAFVSIEIVVFMDSSFAL